MKIENFISSIILLCFFGKATAQLPSKIYNALPDSIKPADAAHITFNEYSKIFSATHGNKELVDSLEPLALKVYADVLREPDRDTRIKTKMSALGSLFFVYSFKPSNSLAYTIRKLCYAQLKDIGEAPDYEKCKAMANYYIASLEFYCKNNLDSALQLNKMVWSYAKAAHDSMAMGYSAYLFGTIYNELESYREAAAWYRTSASVEPRTAHYFQFIYPLHFLEMAGLFANIQNYNRKNGIDGNFSLDSMTYYLEGFRALHFPEEQWGHLYYYYLALKDYLGGNYMLAKSRIDSSTLPRFITGKEIHAPPDWEKQNSILIYYSAGYKKRSHCGCQRNGAQRQYFCDRSLACSVQGCCSAQ